MGDGLNAVYHRNYGKVTEEACSWRDTHELTRCLRPRRQNELLTSIPGIAQITAALLAVQGQNE
jgi:hypothetical protein